MENQKTRLEVVLEEITGSTGRKTRIIQPKNYEGQADQSKDAIIKIGEKLIDNFDYNVPCTIGGTEYIATTALEKYFFHADGPLDPMKGIFIRGNVGTGKTILMDIFRNFAMLLKRDFFHCVSSRELKRKFSIGGFEAVNEFGYNTTMNAYNVGSSSPWVYCFDDLGTEGTNTRHYGESTNILAEIIQDRYEIYSRNGILTHFTTNLTPKELDDFYGQRIRSRIKEMCNDIVLTGKDRRK